MTRCPATTQPANTTPPAAGGCRLGQRRTAHVHKLVCGGTAEEGIEAWIRGKRELAERLVSSSEQVLSRRSGGDDPRPLLQRRPLDRTLAEMDMVERDQALVHITDKIHDLFEPILEERIAEQRATEADASAKRDEQLERLQLEAERLRMEVERSQAEVERLAKEKEEWQGKAKALIEIRTNRGWLVQAGKEWQKKEEAITVSSYREQLAGDLVIIMLRIPEGEFLMGSPESEAGFENKRPQHRVTLGSFFLGQTPVTPAQWKVVAGFPKLALELPANPSAFQGAKLPVEQVSWEQAMEFCRRLSQHTQG